MSEFNPFDGKEPVEGIQYVGEDEEESPPEPLFVVVLNAFGPGAHSVKLPDGTPVGVYVRDNNMSPEDVHEWLTGMGMNETLVEWFVINRRLGIEADKKILASPGMKAFAENEYGRDARMEAYRAELLKRMKK